MGWVGRIQELFFCAFFIFILYFFHFYFEWAKAQREAWSGGVRRLRRQTVRGRAGGSALESQAFFSPQKQNTLAHCLSRKPHQPQPPAAMEWLEMQKKKERERDAKQQEGHIQMSPSKYRHVTEGDKFSYGSIFERKQIERMPYLHTFFLFIHFFLLRI